jgi:spore germination protein YaaH
MKRKNTLKNGKFGQISQENNMKTLLTIVAPRRLVCKNILILLALSIFVLLFFLSQTIKKEATNINKQKIIAAYVPEYSYEYAVENIIFFGPLIDEIILFSVTISEEGRVLFHPQSSGYEIKKVKQLGTLAKANGIKKVLLTIGGGGRSSFFPEVSSCPFKRTTLANELFNVCKQNNLDGIDFDWEGYMSGEDYSNYNLLIQEVKDLFNKKSSENFQDPFMVTVALHYWQTLESSTIKKIDRVHVMLYDLEGRHSTLSATEALIQSMLQKGRIPSKKLLWGIPAYGRYKLALFLTLFFYENM